MRNIVNKIGCVLLAASVMLAAVEFSTIGGFHQQPAPVNCQDASGEAEQAHAEYGGNEIFARITKTQPGLCRDLIGILPDMPDPLTSKYSSIVWQPPRIL